MFCIFNITLYDLFQPYSENCQLRERLRIRLISALTERVEMRMKASPNWIRSQKRSH